MVWVEVRCKKDEENLVHFAFSLITGFLRGIF